MAPARRQGYVRSRSRSYIAPSDAPIAHMPPNQDLMPPSSRYLHNLRVIQRHDPSITSLFDQFPHVCVYHHKGDQWRKKGCEGAMFLFEREEEPKYGFYILNRNNTGDYIQRMTPEDDVEFASAYLIYRAFGKVTSDTIGLWTMVTQDREAMSQVMMRLHSYIKRNIRYPDEYRRRPDTWSTTPAPSFATAISPSFHSPAVLDGSPSARVDPPSTTMTTLSNLLAKLGDSTGSPQDPSPPNRTFSASVPPPTGIPLLDTIFASASASDSVIPADAVTQLSQSNGNTLRPPIVNGATRSGSSSASTSCGPTPTQHISELPRSELPRSSSPLRPKTSNIGTLTAVAGRSVFPNPNATVRNGRESAPVAIRAGLTSEHSNTLKPNGRGFLNVEKRIHSPQYLTIADFTRGDQDGWEEKAIADVGLEANEAAPNHQTSSRRNRARNARKKDRDRERQRSLKRETALGEETCSIPETREEQVVEWPLVDDRSLSLDEDDVAEGGLGEGLLSVLAAVSESEPHDPDDRPAVISKKRHKERGKDRRKRKLKENGATASQTSERAGEACSSPGSRPVEVRTALLDVYGYRRRIGDSVLSEEALAAEVMELIKNDSTFVRELHQQYMRKVQV